MARTRTRSLTLVATAAAFALSGCVPLPPVVTTDPLPPPITVPPAPTTIPEPAPTTPAITTEPTTPASDPPASSGGDIALTDQVPAGNISGWVSQLTTTPDRFTPTDANDFPAGPTIEVIDEETGCGVWAYNARFDLGTDDVALTEALLATVTAEYSGVQPAESVWLGPNMLTGASVEFSVATTESDGIWAVRAYGSIESAQLVQVFCSDPSAQRAQLEDVAANWLAPDFASA